MLEINIELQSCSDRRILRELREAVRLLRIIACDSMETHRSGVVQFKNSEGENVMDITLLVGQTTVASLVEFSGLNGTGDELPNVGVIDFESSDPTIATVDAQGNVNAIAAGSAEITLTDEGNNITNFGTVTVNAAAEVAQSGEVEFSTPIPTPTPAARRAARLATQARPTDPRKNIPALTGNQTGNR